MRFSRNLIFVTLALCSVSAQAQLWGFGHHAAPAAPVPPPPAPAAVPPPAPTVSGPEVVSAAPAAAPAPVGSPLQPLAQNAQAALQGFAQAQQQIHTGIQNTEQQIGTGIKTAAQAIESRVKQAYDSAAKDAQLIATGSTAASNALAQGVAALPGTIQKYEQLIKQNVAADQATIRDTAATVGKVVQQVAPLLPPATQILNPDAWKQTYKAYGPELAASYADLYGTFTAIEQGVEARFCVPTVFTPQVKKPAKFTGPSFSITFQGPSCSLDEDSFINNHITQLACTEPSITYVRSPANYTLKFLDRATLIPKQCSVSQNFGQYANLILYVFDGRNTPDIANLTAVVTSEVKKLLGTTAGSTQSIINNLSAFVAGLNLPKPRLPGLGGLGLGGLGLGGLTGAAPGGGPPVQPTKGAGITGLDQAISSYSG